LPGSATRDTVRAVSLDSKDLDWKDGVTFDQWREQFTNALSGSAGSELAPSSLVHFADGIAQAAVEVIQKRAKEAGR
jgi:hypothetical protein